jgi:hypothetical protein
LES